jgi:hypothetical protein
MIGGAHIAARRMARIPKTLHYCFGLAADFGGRPWSLVHHVCLKSAIEHIAPDAVRLYYHHEPSGPWWDVSRPLVDLVQVDLPDTGSLPPGHAARTDRVKLERLIEHGGIYLDADVLVRRSFDPLLDAGAVVGLEHPLPPARIGNAVVLAEPGALFVQRWLGTLRALQPDPRRPERPAQLPARIAAAHRGEVEVMKFSAFYWPLATEAHVAWMFDTADPVGADDAFARHLRLSSSWDRVAGLTPEMVRNRESNACRWLRPYVADLPDDYGADGPGPPLRAPPPANPPPPPPEPVSRKEEFRRIYAGQHWGGGKGEFFSGSGSRGPAVAHYIPAITAQLRALHASLGRDLVVVDIGCGDYFVGRHLVEACPFIRYVGCDIVPELAENLQARFGSDRVRFESLDIVTNDPPEGDVCLVRQVFQHLSNRDVLAAVQRLRAFEAVYLTETQPIMRHGLPNPDKPSNGHVRYHWWRSFGRGLEWDQPAVRISRRANRDGVQSAARAHPHRSSVDRLITTISRAS